MEFIQFIEDRIPAIVGFLTLFLIAIKSNKNHKNY